MPVSPPEDDLRNALIALRSQYPTLGITKIHSLLLSANPAWSVSENRTKKILRSEGLVLNASSTTPSGASGSGTSSQNLFPTSKVIEGLEISKWTSKVEVRYFGNKKGKGLVATEHIAEGENVWKEEPFVLAPEWDLYDLQGSSVACMYCSTPLSGTSLIATCPSSSQTSPCSARFCSRLCLARSARTHPLLCPARNPASIPLLIFARKNEWLALHALSQCTARVMLTYQQDEVEFKKDWDIVRSFAQLGMEERTKGGWLGGAEPDRGTWKRAYQLFLQAFRDPTTQSDKRNLSQLLKKPLSKELSDHIFDYDAFLRGLGRMSLNLEAHGGLYVLHSHLNHSCTPNISVRHLDQRTALSRITLVAKRDIKPGEELSITYVNPALPLDDRRRQLQEWGFGICRCERCLAEEKEPTTTGSNDTNTISLERELKAGLGVL